MAKKNINQKLILDKLGIEQLNEMQSQAHLAIESSNEVMILSPTGSGKTLGFLLPAFEKINKKIQGHVQILILVPTRELAIQLEQVARDLGTGYKVNSVYGGQLFSKDRTRLKTAPDVLIGTPGRIADHLRRKSFDFSQIHTLVLDEYDKSLEIGFEDQIKEIVYFIHPIEQKILTSATKGVIVPEFMKFLNPVVIDHLDEGVPKIDVKLVLSPTKDKLQTLTDTLRFIGNHPGIVFLNFKNAIERVSEFLDDQGIAHGVFHGGLDQNERERALLKFRNGTHQILLSTDLAARGIDIPEIKFIIHYHLPQREEEFIHRNGRTARMNRSGSSYVIHYEHDDLPYFLDGLEKQDVHEQHELNKPAWTTLYISGGRQDKISKGDIAGMFMKLGQVNTEDLGLIELKQECSFVAVKTDQADTIVQTLNNQRLKKKKVRIYKV